MKLKASEKTLVALANAGELVSIITQGVVGDEVADSLNDAPLTRQAVYNFAQAGFGNDLSTYLGAK